MPETEVLFFRDGSSVPALEWLDEVYRRDRRAYNKCVELIARLESSGHELKRPIADILEDGICELRARVGSVNYRMLYFFHGRYVAVLACGLTKEKSIPRAMLTIAKRRKSMFESNPEAHTYREDGS